MKASPLVLDSYVITHFSFRTVAHEEEADVGAMSQIKAEDVTAEVWYAEHVESALRRRVQILIGLSKGSEVDYNYAFEIGLVGFFCIDETWPAEEIDALVQINAPSLLYSAAREFVASTTGRGPYPELLLPSVRFFSRGDDMVPESAPAPKAAARGRKRSSPEETLTAPKAEPKKTPRKASR